MEKQRRTIGSHRVYRERTHAFGQQLLTFRTRGALTQGELAAQIGVHRRSLQKWEGGESYPKAETLQRLIAVFLAQGVFIPGQEAAEAAQLWEQSSQDAPHPLGAFDAAWFARLLEERSATPASLRAPSTPLTPASALDRVLPEGLVTFLATDIEGSTRRWEHAPQAMQQALARQHAILRRLTELYHGHVVHTAGDSFICVFADASAALQSALALQRALLAEPWPEVVAPLLIRIALHSGAATTQGAGAGAEPTLNRLSRVLALSQGGQILLTQATIDLIGARWPDGVTRHNLGVQQLRDVTMPLQLWQARVPDLPTTDHRLPTTDRRGITNTDNDAPLHPFTPSAVIDWGEAIAVPTLYGRESELGTLQRWVVDERCRVVAILGLGGMGKSSLAITLAHQVLARFDVVLFRSLQNRPPLAELLDQTIRVISGLQATSPEQLGDKIARLVQLLRERRCLLILDNLESLLEPDALSGTYRSGYADYGALMYALSEREHQSCLLLTSREKPAELGPHEGSSAPVRTLQLAGLDDGACQLILEAKDITGTATTVSALARLYGGNPLAIQLISEPIHELFGGDVAAFLAMGDVFFNGVGQLLAQQFGRSTPLEQAILYWLAIERELVPLSVLLANLREVVPQRALLVALESLRRRMLIEHAAGQPTFTLQPVILEYVTDQLVDAVHHELVDGQPKLLLSHALVRATSKDYIRHSQEQLLATPLLERLLAADGSADAVEHRLLALIASWRDRPLIEAGYGPGNIVNLLRLLRGHLRGLDLERLVIRQAYLQGVEMQDTMLSGAIVQDSVFTDTFNAIMTVAISSSGEYWAALSRRGELRLWSADGRTLQRVWQAHTDVAWPLAFSPDGRLLASWSGDGAIKLWDVASGVLLWSGWHAGIVYRMAISPDGNTLASCGNDATVRLWDIQSGRQLETLLHTAPVIAIAWRPDGRLLASGDEDGAIRLWEVHATQPTSCVQTFAGQTKHLGLTFSPDGSTLASGSEDVTARLWEIPSGQLRQTLVGHSYWVSRVVWSPDGRTLAICSGDPVIWLWDLEQGQYRAALQGHVAIVWCLAFTPDSRGLLSGSEDGTLRLWDLASARCVQVLQGYSVSLSDVDWSPDGTQLVCGGSDAPVMIWDVADRTPPRMLHGHGESVFGIGWSPDGRWVAGAWDMSVFVWDLESNAQLQMFREAKNNFNGVAWSPDGTRLASGTYRHGVLVWDVAAGVQRWLGRQLAVQFMRVAWSPDGTRLAGGGDDGHVYLWEVAQDVLLQHLPGHQGPIKSVAWSPDGTRLASSGGGRAGGELFVWDMRHSERLRAFEEHPEIAYAVAWGASEDLLISGGGDGKLRWWDVRSGECVRVCEAHQGTVQSLRRSPDGAKLASCGDDGAIMLWNLRTGEYLQTLRRDRPYERVDITGLTGLTAAQRASLFALGALERPLDHTLELATTSHSTVADQPARGEQQVVSSLPFQSTSFIGRSVELAALTQLLADPQCRLLTLLGPGGIGKTRLALAVAANQVATFADGVAFVALASVSTPNQIGSAIGESLHLDFASQPDPTAHLLGYLRDRHMLLVLDNFEHLLDGVDLVADILAHAPQLTMLITSRERLNLRAEWVFDVDGLTYPHQETYTSSTSRSPADLTEYSAVQLFVQRARQVQPDLALDEARLTTIVRICEQVAGMPLAIELAAAGTRRLSLAEIERQIGANLDGLASTFRDVPKRHRSMRAVFDHSWNLLSASEQALFCRLAVFRGGWTLAAAEQVVDATLSALIDLLDKSLIRYSTEFTNPSDAGRPQQSKTPRFFMLEPLREYALERLADDPNAEVVRQQHARYFTEFAEVVQKQLSGSSQEPMLQRLAIEHDNVRAALHWTLHAGEAALGLRLGGAFADFWFVRGYMSEGRRWLEALLERFPSPVKERLHVIHCAFRFAQSQGDSERSVHLAEQGLPLARAVGDEGWIAEFLATLGIMSFHQQDIPRAKALFEEALPIFRRLAILEGVANVLFNLGRIAGLGEGDIARATRLLAESLGLYQQLNDSISIVYILLHQGTIAVMAEDADQATKDGVAALRLAWSSQFIPMVGYGFALLAIPAIMQKNFERGVKLFAVATHVFDDLGIIMAPTEQARYNHWMKVAREGLDAATFGAVWAEGLSMPREQAFGYALDLQR